MSTAQDPAGALRWTEVVDGPRSGAENMARDEALARFVSDAVEAGGTQVLPAFLRFYAWERPTLSFGRNEPARGRFDPGRLDEAGVDVVRRPTGGRAVLHDREVTYAVIVPARSLGGPRETYRRVNEVLAAAVAALGADTELASDRPAAGLDAGPCFDLPAGGEVVVQGRKLVGSAQARVGGALLQHGSILLHDDQTRIDDLAEAGAGVAGAEVRPVTLAELIDPAPAASAVIDAVSAAARALPGTWGGNAALPEARAYVARYRSSDWTWRK